MNKPHSITLFYSHSYSQKIIVLWNPGRVWLRCIVILSSYELTWKLIHNSSRLNSNLNKHFNNPSHFGDILNFWYFELFQKIVHTTSTSCIIPLYSTNILVCHFFFLMIHQAQKNANTWLRYILNHWRLNEKNFLLGYPTLCSSFLIDFFFFSSQIFYLFLSQSTNTITKLAISLPKSKPRFSQNRTALQEGCQFWSYRI